MADRRESEQRVREAAKALLECERTLQMYREFYRNLVGFNVPEGRIASDHPHVTETAVKLAEQHFAVDQAKEKLARAYVGWQMSVADCKEKNDAGTREQAGSDAKAEWKADFLWPCEDGSVEEAGFEFANAKTEEFRRIWWSILLGRLPQTQTPVKSGRSRT